MFASSIDIVQQMVSQGSDAVEIQLYGPDINKLYKIAQHDLIPQLAQIKGIVRPDTNITPSQPEVDINVDRRVAAQLGLSTGDVANIISTATSGTIASYWQTNGTQYPIMVQLPPEQRRTLDSLGSLLIQPNPAAAASVGGTTVGNTPAAGSGQQRRQRAVVAVAQTRSRSPASRSSRWDKGPRRFRARTKRAASTSTRRSSARRWATCSDKSRR